MSNNPYPRQGDPLPTQSELDDWNAGVDRARLEAMHHPITYGHQLRPSRGCPHCREIHGLQPPNTKDKRS